MVETQDDGLRLVAAKALIVWATKDNIPALKLLLIDRSAGSFVPWGPRYQALHALATTRHPEAIAAIATQLSDSSGYREAGKALREIGAAAEEEVASYLTHKERTARIEACRILAVIGTKKSIPDLEKAVTVDLGLEKEVDTAIQAISERP